MPPPAPKSRHRFAAQRCFPQYMKIESVWLPQSPQRHCGAGAEDDARTER